MDLSILYRGPLASCDYDCSYCPFAKRRDTPRQLRADRDALAGFANWVGEWRGERAGDKISVLFTPWGEALTRSWYRQTMTEFSHLSHVAKVAVQTNLSCRLDWLDAANLGTLALWCTYHPDQVDYERFLAKCLDLHERGVRYSVGVVGQPEHLDAANRLRADLPDDIYLWINAAEGLTYSDDQAADWARIDALFPVSRFAHPSRGRDCRTGESVISVDGTGDVRRCHFVSRNEPGQRLGNLYDGTFRPAAGPRPCPLDQCDCHIGYVHMPELGLYDTFAGGILERIPAHRELLTITPAHIPTLGEE